MPSPAHLRVVALSLGLITIATLHSRAQEDAEEFSRAHQLPDPVVRFQAIEAFVKKYPASDFIRQAKQMLWNDALTLKQNDKALSYALEYITLVPDRTSAYNDVAWQFAEHGVHLDSALAFVNRALEEYQRVRGRKSAAYLDTKAWVLYKRGELPEALTAQQEAVAFLPKGAEWNPQFAEYYYRLGLYLTKTEKTTGDFSQREEGLRMLARTVFLGAADALPQLQELLSKEENVEARQRQLLENAAADFINHADDPIIARANVALGLAKQNMLLDQALQYANEAYAQLSKRSNADQRLTAGVALGIVHYHRNDYQTAVRYLSEAARFASPYAEDLYLYLGKSFEQQGKQQEAFNSYLMGVIAFRFPDIMERLIPLFQQLHGPDTLRTLDAIISATAKKTEHFASGTFIPQRGPGSNRIVVAELFTGSECKPCAASDLAYDRLLERYNRSTLAVLEYHLHIPAPDPMTNSDTEERAKYYGVNSTPTSFIDGMYKAVGGGPRVAARSRFEIYTYAIETRLEEKSSFKIYVDGHLNGDMVKTTASCMTTKKSPTLEKLEASPLFFRVVLVEDSVAYLGTNGITPHRFVVRKLLRSPSGAALNNRRTAKIDETFSLQTLQDSLKSYLDTFEAKTSSGRAFKEKKHIINSDNLYLIAFVQDDATKEILQASVKKIKRVNRSRTMSN